MLLNPTREVYREFIKKPSEKVKNLFKGIIAEYKTARGTEHVPLEALEKIVDYINAPEFDIDAYSSLGSSSNYIYGLLFGEHSVVRDPRSFSVYVVVQVYGHGGACVSGDGSFLQFVNTESENAKVNLLSLLENGVDSLTSASFVETVQQKLVVDMPANFSENISKLHSLLSSLDSEYSRMYEGNLGIDVKESIHAAERELEDTGVTTVAKLTLHEAKIKRDVEKAMVKNRDEIYCMAYDIGTPRNGCVLKYYTPANQPSDMLPGVRSHLVDAGDKVVVSILKIKVLDFEFDPIFELTPTTTFDLHATLSTRMSPPTGERFVTFSNIYDWAFEHVFSIFQKNPDLRDLTKDNCECTFNFIDLLCNSVDKGLRASARVPPLTQHAITAKETAQILKFPGVSSLMKKHKARGKTRRKTRR